LPLLCPPERAGVERLLSFAPAVGYGSIAASGLKTLNDCSQSDPAFGARPQQ